MSLPDLSLARVFYDRAREVYLETRPSIDVTPDQLLAIASDVSTQLELVRLVRELNDPEFRQLLILFLEDAADKLEEAAGNADDAADLLDRAGLAPAVTVTTGAIALTLATGGAAVPVVVVFLGAGGMIALGFGRTTLKSKSRREKSGAKKLLSLAAKLKGV
ncbi:hypothetical protein DDF62_17310 [Caulobacter radicis]|uniref:hypothetical protein n=1 Tax=Caulobacter radicis TaxID=2172650 RepID=UPI000D569F9F|nr:hypothetical protein [Caulobacter radicis]PVM86812.1 hypothetical protein DDF62_17310 [Caulobacter radicis]